VIIGGTGHDSLYGGADSDVFRFNTAGESDGSGESLRRAGRGAVALRAAVSANADGFARPGTGDRRHPGSGARLAARHRGRVDRTRHQDKARWALGRGECQGAGGEARRGLTRQGPGEDRASRGRWKSPVQNDMPQMPNGEMRVHRLVVRDQGAMLLWLRKRCPIW
jgi:hypothetical protein